MQETQTAAPVSARPLRAAAALAVRGKLGRARFTRTDATFDVRKAEVRIGVWVLDRASAEYPPGMWPLRRATVHWRRDEIIVANALNYEFQIEEEVPYALLTNAEFHPNKVVFVFGRAMRMTVGVRELSVSCRRSKEMRTDWGVRSWAFTW